MKSVELAGTVFYTKLWSILHCTTEAIEIKGTASAINS